MIITQHPGAIHTIFNPCIIKATKEAEAKAKIYIAFGIYGALPVDYIIAEREYFNDEASFNIKKILKNGIGSGITAIVGSPCWIDQQFFVEYTVFDDTETFVYSATALNAVVQVQESSNLTDIIDTKGYFRTRFDYLKRFDGYPLEIVAFSFRTGDTYIRLDGDDFAQVVANVFVIPVTDQHYSIEIGNQNYDTYLRDNQGRVVEDNLGNGITYTTPDVDYKEFIIPIDNPILPDTPFYIHWINQQGGLDHWMFGYRQFKNRAIANQQTFNPYVEDQETVKGFIELVMIDGIEKVKVGASGLSQNDFDCLSKLIYSPQIEWFNEVTQSWQTLLIDGDGLSEDDTHDVLNELEFTFKLPTPQLQF